MAILDTILRFLGYEYSDRVHIKRSLKQVKWLFWLAVAGLIISVVIVVRAYG